MKPVIFLDFDGVLNTPDTWCKRPLETEAIDSDKVMRLSDLAEQLDADIVISSSWRQIFELPALRAMLADKGLRQPDRVVDCTEVIGIDRGDEVGLWLGRNRRLEVPFVILDDVGFYTFDGFERQLIRTDFKVGLTDEDCRRAREAVESQRIEPV